MRIFSRIASVFQVIGIKANPGGVTYYFDSRKGIVELRTDPALQIRMELFKRFVESGNWGIELTIRNKGAAAYDELLVVFNKKFSMIIQNLKPDTMKIKSLEFKPEEFDTDALAVDISIIQGRGKKERSEAYSLSVPMSSILEELKDAGKITPIEDDETKAPIKFDKSIVGNFEAEFIRQASIKPRVDAPQGNPAQSRDAMLGKIAELDSQKQEIQKSFMKREIDYATFSQLMNPIVQESILLKAQIAKLQAR